jgi:phosphatidylinositol alpha-1,6-mannosyltransferase
VPSLLVTNDFPPKVGGIQSYLWELWRRLPPGEVSVLTTPHPGAASFDAAQDFLVDRVSSRWLLPTTGLRRRVEALVREVGAGLVFLDPALPVGALGPRLSVPYVAVLHGAEVTVPGRLPGVRSLLGGVLGRAAGVLAAGSYPARKAAQAVGHPLPGLIIPPGVDAGRFHPAAGADERAAARSRFGLPGNGPLIVGVSRLVPRKGFDVLIDAVARLGSDVALALAGAGRDGTRLARRAARRGLAGRFRLLGPLPEADLPALYATADVFAMLCRERWGGLEAEGFGIVFLEAAACGVPAVAGRSGGSEEAVADGETGFVVDPRDPGAAADALARLLDDPDRRTAMGVAARRRALESFSYDALAARLLPLARGDTSVLAPVGVR